MTNRAKYYVKVEKEAPQGLACPSCGDQRSTVMETRKIDVSVMRRRRCYGCGARFKTLECVVVAAGNEASEV